MAAGPQACGLCGAPEPRAFASAHSRDFFECTRCMLVQVGPSQRPGPHRERARYETHRNDPADQGYRAFLQRLARPLVSRLHPGASGLDYGSGPGPTLSVILEEAGHPTALYDPFFAPDEGALQKRYDFITCTEAAEHFHDPGLEFDRIERLLKPGGWLGLMTGIRDERRSFESWWYVRDETHVCFYHPTTLEWIADHYGWALDRPGDTVALFRKPMG